MNTTMHSFMDIFNTTFSEGQDKVKLQKIIIPIIQRDYAQGRRNPDVDRIRSRFLDTLYEAVLNQPIALDFVYGDIDDNGIMTPLDGQQRLTTLFLLHWYAAKKNRVSAEESAFLFNFSYETRYSARYFCKELIEYMPQFTGILSEEIIDQNWFPLEWQKDPTISSMLVMLDDIDRKFSNVSDLWQRLKDGVITFYFLPIKDMGLTDELYIKMNSRGKPLTRFEHFKAELERCIRTVDDSAADRIIRKIDIDWTDMLWRYRSTGDKQDRGAVIDDAFLKYFHFICDVICFQSGESPQGRSDDEFDMLTEYFSGDGETVCANIRTLEEYFDCWCRIDGFDNPSDFLDSYISHVSETGKIVVDGRSNIDIFGDCLRLYSDMSGSKRQFPLNRIVLLFGIICYLRNKAGITDAEFRCRLRVVNNLIQNSEDEISDRIDRNRMPAVLRQTESVMLSGIIDKAIENNFNVSQVEEEEEKRAFLEKYPEQAQNIYLLEDHPRLRGQISIIGLEHLDLADRFVSLFECDSDLIDCALMTTGDYGQQERRKWRYQYGSKGMQTAWDNLFHKSGNGGFENTGRILVTLLSKAEVFTNAVLHEIVEDFIKSCEKENQYPWRYYYVKYDAFRPGSYGKYSNLDKVQTPYVISVLLTQYHWSQSTYMPYLKEVDEAHLLPGSFGQTLAYGEVGITCANSAYVLSNITTKETIDTITIQQDENGIDTQDRVEVLKQLVDRLKQMNS